MSLAGLAHAAAPRSFLFAPGDNPRLLAKVATVGADAVVLDLEDAVAARRKVAARENVGGWLEAREATAHHDGEPTPEIWVRTNGLDGPLWRDDLDTVVRPGLTGLRIPKADSAEALHTLDEALRPLESAHGLAEGSLAVTCTLESAAGIWNLRSLVEAPRVVQLAFGEADFVADIGATAVPEASLVARSQLVLASRVAGLRPPIAPVYTHLDDTEGLESSSRAARDLGFGARSCIHPKQLDAIHRVFTPDPEQVAEARALVDTLESSDGGGTAHQGQFVDEAVVRRARRILAQAAAHGSTASREEGAR